MKKCANCGAENSPDAKICTYCNSPLEAEDKPFRELKANGRIAEENRCSICNGGMEVGEDIIQCSKCLTYYHKGCFENNNGCSSCMEELKECPYCKNKIKKFAVKCRYCGRYLDSEISRSTETVPKGRHPDASQALIFGILSIFCCAVIFGPIAISRANKAIKDIDSDPGYTGREMANAGKIIAIVGLCLWGLGILIQIASYSR